MTISPNFFLTIRCERKEKKNNPRNSVVKYFDEVVVLRKFDLHSKYMGISIYIYNM